MRPWKIIVVTSLCEAFNSHRAAVEEMGIPIFKWDIMDCSCIPAIKQIVADLLSLELIGALEVTSPRVDVCIISALVDPEYTALCDAFADVEWRECSDVLPNSKLGEFISSSDESIRILLVSAGEMGGVPMATLTSSIIRRFLPKLIIMSGICGGLPSKVEIGDLVCATEMVHFGSGKVFEGIFIPDSFSVSTHSHNWPILADRDSMTKVLHVVNSRWNGARPPRKDQNGPKFILGQSGCSDLVVADSDFVGERLKSYRQMVAVEMEGYGAGYAIRQSGKKTGFLMFKSVCDMADPEKRDEYQQYCAFMSATFIRELLSQGMIR